MKVLVACEFSGIVRDAFLRRGHDAFSCDLLPSESNAGPHYEGDVLDILNEGWDLIIAHPPCTYLAVSGARWWPERQREQAEAVEFVRRLMAAPAPRIAIENPVSLLSTVIRKPDQVVQPWMFGHRESKATCLWLTGLPLLRPTQVMRLLGAPRVHYAKQGPDRWRERSRTYTGLAAAMAEQWG